MQRKYLMTYEAVVCVYNQERILILDLLKILQQHTDENHRLTQKELIRGHD